MTTEKKSTNWANKRNLLVGFLAGICVVLSCAQSSDLVIYAKDVLFNDDVAMLGADNVQVAVEKVAAKADSVDWSKVTNRPSGLDDGDDVGNYTAGTGLKIDGTTISVDIGTSSGQVAGGADLQALQTEIAALKAQLAGDCPAGYTKDTTVTNYTVCKNGKDEMVKVGDFWVDRYEASIVDATTYDGGKCDGSGTQHGVGTDDYPQGTFPDSANVAGGTKLYACSTGGNLPSANMTWFQAVAACVYAGKHLCINGEWQAAAFGTPDASASCNLTASAANTGSTTLCLSQFGAFDMVGNLWEWVDFWGQGGNTWMTTTSGGYVEPWPPSGSYGDGKDGTWGVNTAVKGEIGAAFLTNGMPAAGLRGGNAGTAAGVFALSLELGPSMAAGHIGARCCRR